MSTSTVAYERTDCGESQTAGNRKANTGHQCNNCGLALQADDAGDCSLQLAIEGRLGFLNNSRASKSRLNYTSRPLLRFSFSLYVRLGLHGCQVQRVQYTIQ